MGNTDKSIDIYERLAAALEHGEGPGLAGPEVCMPRSLASGHLPPATAAPETVDGANRRLPSRLRLAPDPTEPLT